MNLRCQECPCVVYEIYVDSVLKQTAYGETATYCRRVGSMVVSSVPDLARLGQIDPFYVVRIVHFLLSW